MATTTSVLTVGPIPLGAGGGNAFDDGTYSTIRSIKIQHSDIVYSIQIEYDDNGKSVWSPQHGGSNNDIGDMHKDTIKLNYPDEFLVSVFGTCTVEFPDQQLVIRTLEINSNIRTYGPYGTPKAGAQSFSTASAGCKIVGFLGRSDRSLDSIGIYLVPHYKISIGPFGGGGGNTFDDGIYPAIRKLIIRYVPGFISLQTVYINYDGHNKVTSEHGSKAGGTVAEVDLDEDEYLISLSGYYTDDSNPVVQSLTFQSNKKTYEYGTAQGIPFSTSTGTGKIIGFHGASAEYINSIGAYFEPLAITP